MSLRLKIKKIRLYNRILLKEGTLMGVIKIAEKYNIGIEAGSASMKDGLPYVSKLYLLGKDNNNNPVFYDLKNIYDFMKEVAVYADSYDSVYNATKIELAIEYVSENVSEEIKTTHKTVLIYFFDDEEKKDKIIAEEEVNMINRQNKLIQTRTKNYDVFLSLLTESGD